MRILLLAFVLAACCPPASRENARDQVVASPLHRSLRELAGLYVAQPSRLCIVASRFALVIHGAGPASCSGSGSIVRKRDTLRFSMRGDSRCGWEARIVGTSIVFPTRIAPSCAYYCAAGATLAGARLAQSGTGWAQAMRAKDLVGEPLCGEE